MSPLETDEFSMSSQASFKEILREKMGEPQRPSLRDDLNVINSDPAHLAFLLGKVERPQRPLPRGNYPRPSLRPMRKPHVFTSRQEQAFNFIRSWVPTLNDNFSEQELKKAFRQGALRLHPDQGGSDQLFTELKDHYHNLREFFKK